ncbi:MAG TPA: hypothetical protein VGA13_06160 [Acidimicrobiales bacterium]
MTGIRPTTLMAATVLVASLVAVATPSRADHALLHDCGEIRAPARFPVGFAELLPVDVQCDALNDSDNEPYLVGGFGGSLDDDEDWDATFAGDDADRPDGHHPVIFVHGNVVDHADWYPVRDQMIRAGWPADELWAVSYNGMGNDSGSAGGTPNPRRDAEHAGAGHDGTARNTSNEVNADEVARFIEAVLDWTEANSGNTPRRFSIVGHSLGVTVARRALELLNDSGSLVSGSLVAFVGIAGANDGTTPCPPGSGFHLDEDGSHLLNSCDELEQGSDWLDELNASPDEFSGTAVMTVYDGTGLADIAYLGPTYAQSPALGPVAERYGWSRSADNLSVLLDCTFPGRGHNDLRLSAGIVDAYMLDFIAEAGVGSLPMDCPADPLGLRTS